ncbi:putative cysteine peptidase [Mycoplasma sp. 653B]|uniref:putative cysteine peptidase n=1 Tax=Mycoplasma sp. 653B TaxID=3401677 RepID=UPI003AACA8E9
MKSLKTFLSISFLFSSAIFVPSMVGKVQNSADTENDIIIKSELARMNKIDKNIHIVNYTKIIEDIHKHKYLLICFDNMYSIIDLRYLISTETRWGDISQYQDLSNLTYVPSKGIFEKINNNSFLEISTKKYYSFEDIKDFEFTLYLPKDSFFKQEQLEKRRSEIKNLSRSSIPKNNEKPNPYAIIPDADIWHGSKRTFISTPNVTDLADHSWWWLTRDSYSRIGYDEDRADEYFDKKISSGWCCYNALSNLILYNELFKHDGLFSDAEYKRFITDDYNPDNLMRYTSPVWKWNKYNDVAATDSERKTFAYYLHQCNDKNYNNFAAGQTGWAFDQVYKRFIEGKKAKDLYQPIYSDTRSVAFKKGWEYITKYKIPVILTTVGVKGNYNKFDHAFVAYGYDSDTDQFLITNLWGKKETNACLLSYYLGAYRYSMFTLYPVNYSDYHSFPKSYFKYKDSEYTWKEVEAHIIYDQSAKV